jgi:glycerate 2-kinase
MFVTAMASELRKAGERTSGARRDAFLAAAAALRGADPRLMVKRAFKLHGDSARVGGRTMHLDGYRRIIVLGAGKASALMAAELERILGGRVDDGVVIAPEYQHPLPKLTSVELARSTHPLPSEKGVRAAVRLLAMLDGVSKEDLVVCALSGGASSLMPLPVEGVSVNDLAWTTMLLQKAGADIGEVNCVRKHLSRIAGGRLAEKARGAEVLSLIISDVVGDDLSAIASGPTAPDPTTFADAEAILKRLKVWGNLPAPVRGAVRAGVEGRTSETPKPGSSIFERVNNVLVGSNRAALVGAKTFLEREGYHVSSFRGSVTGEARVVGKELAILARVWGGGTRRGAVWGGETTVTVRGKGAGGRNQEVVLAAALTLRRTSGITVISFGTDGIDGPTDAAGAIADSTTFARAKAHGLDPIGSLENNDSYSFFKALGDLVVTGPTGTNVNDVMLALREED